MSYSQINKSTDYFNTKLYTGNASSRTISGIGFQPDFTWSKNRGNDDNHYLYDAVRGATKYIISDHNVAEGTASGITAWNADGYTLGSSVGINANGITAVSWNWLASNTTASNTDGSITSTVSVNTTSGFSIVSYTGTGANATVGTGLGSVPAMIMIKNLGSTDSWMVYHKNSNATPEDYILQLNTNIAATDNNTVWNDTAPTSSVFSIGTDAGVNGNGANYIAYCFAEKVGYSKFGSYSGNGNVDGNFLYTGMKPSLFIHKRVDTTGNWGMFDNKRSTSDGNNVINKWLNPDLYNVEGSSSTAMNVDFVSNGVKIREDNGDLNASGGNYVYMCFGQSLVGSNNVPCTAR